MMESERPCPKLSKNTLVELKIQGQIEDALDEVELKMPLQGQAKNTLVETKTKMSWIRPSQRCLD